MDVYFKLSLKEKIFLQIRDVLGKGYFVLVKLKARKANLYFCLHPAPSGNHEGPKGDPQQSGWDNCLSYLWAACLWPEKEREGLDVRRDVNL